MSVSSDDEETLIYTLYIFFDVLFIITSLTRQFVILILKNIKLKTVSNATIFPINLFTPRNITLPAHVTSLHQQKKLIKYFSNKLSILQNYEKYIHLLTFKIKLKTKW